MGQKYDIGKVWAENVAIGDHATAGYGMNADPKRAEGSMATIRLDGPQIEELKNLLGAAFLPPRFTEFLLYRLNRNIWNYTGATDDYPTILLCHRGT